MAESPENDQKMAEEEMMREQDDVDQAKMQQKSEIILKVKNLIKNNKKKLENQIKKKYQHGCGLDDEPQPDADDPKDTDHKDQKRQPETIVEEKQNDQNQDKQEHKINGEQQKDKANVMKEVAVVVAGTSTVVAGNTIISVVNKNNDEDKNDSKDSKDNKDVPRGTASTNNALINLLKATFEIGLVTIPVVFAKAGWLSGIVFVPLIGYLIYYTLCLMLRTCEHLNIYPKNLPEFLSLALDSGTKHNWWINFFLFTLQISLCLAYCIFFTLFFQYAFCAFTNGALCEYQIWSYVLSAAIVVPLSLIKDIGELGKLSLAGNILAGIALIAIVIYSSMVLLGYEEKEASDNIHPVDITYIPYSIGILLTVFSVVGIFFDVRSSMEKPEELRKVFLINQHSGAFLFTIVGLLAYLAIGNELNSIVLLDLPLDNKIYIIVLFLFCINLTFTFPLNLFPCAVILEDLFYPPKPQFQQLPQDENQVSNDQNKNKNFVVYAIRITISLTLIILSFFLSNIGSLFGFFGCMSGMILMFVMPIMVFRTAVLKDKEINKYENIGQWVTLVIGITFGFIGMYVSGQEVVKDFMTPSVGPEGVDNGYFYETIRLMQKSFHSPQINK